MIIIQFQVMDIVSTNHSRRLIARFIFDALLSFARHSRFMNPEARSHFRGAINFLAHKRGQGSRGKGIYSTADEEERQREAYPARCRFTFRLCLSSHLLLKAVSGLFAYEPVLAAECIREWNGWVAITLLLWLLSYHNILNKNYV